MEPESEREPVDAVREVRGSALVLARVSAVKKALDEASSIDEVKRVAAAAEGLLVVARKVNSSRDLADQCGELLVRAKRRLGELLIEQIQHHGGRRKRSNDSTVSRKTLDDVGITKYESVSLQRLAALDTTVFENALVAVRTGDFRGITPAGVIRAARASGTAKDRRSGRNGPRRLAREYRDAIMATLGSQGVAPGDGAAAPGFTDAVEPPEPKEIPGPSGTAFLNLYWCRSSGPSDQTACLSGLADRMRSGEVVAAVVLVGARTDTDWFAKLWTRPLCFLDHLLRIKSDGAVRSGAPAAVFAYFGSEPERFVAAFEKLGRVLVPSA